MIRMLVEKCLVKRLEKKKIENRRFGLHYFRTAEKKAATDGYGKKYERLICLPGQLRY